MRARTRQRGVALITAVLIVALATILAINVTFRGMVDQRRSATCSHSIRRTRVALGAEAWAADFLRKDAQESQTDHLGETWAKPLPPLPVGEGIGVVEGRLEDMQGRFNINSLVVRTDGTTNPVAVKQLERLLAMRGIEIEPTLGDGYRRLDRFRRAIPAFPTARRTAPIPARIRRTSPQTCRSRA